MIDDLELVPVVELHPARTSTTTEKSNANLGARTAPKIASACLASSGPTHGGDGDLHPRVELPAPWPNRLQQTRPVVTLPGGGSPIVNSGEVLPIVDR